MAKTTDDILKEIKAKEAAKIAEKKEWNRKHGISEYSNPPLSPRKGMVKKVEQVQTPPPIVDASAASTAAATGVFELLAKVNDGLDQLKEESLHKEKLELFAQSRTITSETIKETLQTFKEDLLGIYKNIIRLTDLISYLFDVQTIVVHSSLENRENLEKLVDKLMAGRDEKKEEKKQEEKE
jgi:hypothetical protein